MPNPLADPGPAEPGSAAQSRALDRFAILLSGLCLVHCLAVPFALFLGPFLGGWLLESETTVHWLLLALAIPSSAIALGRGYLKHHSRLTLVLGAVGIVLMFLGVSHLYGESAEVVLTSIGVTTLLIAHVRNVLHLSARHQQGHEHEH